MRTLAEIDADIARTKQEIENVQGTATEVYARIVGYYRSVRNWNKGKREEYNHRKLFVPSEESTAAHLQNAGSEPCVCGNATAPGAFSRANEPVRYELFSRKTCPNCPPVKEFCRTSFANGTIIDVDTEEGLQAARQKNVLSTPTVIVYAGNGTEICRAHSVKDLQEAAVQMETRTAVSA